MIGTFCTSTGNKTRLVVVALFLLLSASPLRAEDGGEEVSASYAEIIHIDLSQRVDSLSRQLDAFFGGREAFDEATGSYLKLKTSATMSAGSGTDFDNSVRLKLRLPRTEDRLHLVVYGDPESEAEEESVPLPEALDDDKEDNFFTEVRVALGNMVKWKTTIGLGVRWKFPIDPFARLRLRLSSKLGSWQSRTAQTFLYFLNDGFASRTGLDLDHSFFMSNLFRASSQAVYTEEKKLTELSQYLTILQPLGADASLAYRVGCNGTNKPMWQMDNYLADLTYRQPIWYKWLFLSLRAGNNWPRTRDFRPTPFCSIKFEAVFGPRD